MQKKDLPDYDIAIVGGGISGIYTAWRMMNEGTEHSELLRKWQKKRGKLKIAVFEGTDRIGGRLLSAKATGLPNIVCELGGMRYVSDQFLVRSLVEKKFNLPAVELPVSEGKNIMFLRGKHLRESDLNQPDTLPYNFNKDEIAWLKKKGNTADNFLGYAVEKIFPDITKYVGSPALRTYLNKQVVDGVPLYQHGFWNLVAKQLSHEAYEVAVTTVGYDCLGFNTNAVDAICEYFDFTPSVTYKKLVNGYESLVWEMQADFQKAGGTIVKGKWLESFDSAKLPDKTKGVSLKFKGNKKELSARCIVLAMPRRSLELLAQKGPVLDPALAPHMRYMMDAVEPICLYKMFIAYEQPWWEKKDVSTGRSVTDIPIRQCYYWGVNDTTPKADKKNNPAMIMVYNDALSSDFWGGLRRVPLGPGDEVTDYSDINFKRKKQKIPKLPPNVTPDNKKLFDNWAVNEAPKAMIAEMHRELQLMHGVTNAPEPIDASFKDWGDDPYGGAVHFWNAGYQSDKILKAMIQPVKDFPCYVCGEAYSTNQTWAEGALQTAELVLRKFSIPQPKWLIKK